MQLSEVKETVSNCYVNFQSQEHVPVQAYYHLYHKASSSFQYSNTFNFEQHVQGKSRNLNTRTGGFMCSEKFCVHSIHARKFIHILDEDLKAATLEASQYQELRGRGAR